MEAAQNIREAVTRVVQLRQQRLADTSLGTAVLNVKRLQSRRFSANYADLRNDVRYQAAVLFFLKELYSDRDFSERDAQFFRIAGAMQRVVPEQVAVTAVSLAELHALTEDLDQEMGIAWSRTDSDQPDAIRYVQAWRMTGREADRRRQLRVVIGIGMELGRLVRTPGLRLLLKMMRGPAAAAGLASLQAFLEEGFDIFALLARPPERVTEFLGFIEVREADLMSHLFTSEVPDSAAVFQRLLDSF